MHQIPRHLHFFTAEFRYAAIWPVNTIMLLQDYNTSGGKKYIREYH